MALSLDATTANGNLAILSHRERPHIETNLIIDRLDLDRYLPEDTLAVKSTRTGRVTDRVTSLFESLGTVTAQAAVELERLRVAGAWVRGVTLKIALDEGALTIEEAEIAQLLGASVALAGRLERANKAAASEFRADMLLRADIRELVPVSRWLGLSLPVAPAALAPVTLEGRVFGSFERIDLDLSGAIAGGRATVGGSIDRPDTSHPGPIALEIRYDHPSHRALAERFAISGLRRSAVRPVHLRLKVEGETEQLMIGGRLEALGGEARFEGTRSGPPDGSRLVGTLGVSHPELLRLLRMIAPDYQARAADLGPLNLKTRLDLASGSLALNEIDAKLGPTNLAGDIVFKRTEGQPSVVADITTGVLAVDMFLPPEEPGSRWSTAVVDLSGLQDVDATLRLMSDAIAVDRYRLEDARMAARLQDGVLRLDSLEGVFFDARTKISGHADLRLVLPTIAVDVSLEEGDLAPVLEAVFEYRPVTGRFDFAGRFAARGNSPFGLVNTLGGEASLTVSDGRLRGFDLSRLTADIEGVQEADAVPALLDRRLSGGLTLLERLEAKIVARNGVLRARDIQAQLGSGGLSMEAEIDLPGWSIASSGQLSLAAFRDAPPIVVEIGGNLENPVAALEARGLRLWLIQRLAQRAYTPIPVSGAIRGNGPAVPEVVGPADGSGANEVAPESSSDDGMSRHRPGS